MALPVTIPNTFANATTSIPLSQLDANFSTLSNAVNGINSGAETLANLKASNVTITGGTISNVTLDNVTVQTESFDNVTMSNVTITSGNATFTNVTCTLITNGAGTSAAPSITTTGDPNTGIFFPAADTIAFAEGGAEAMRIDSSGNLGFAVTPTASTIPQIEGGSNLLIVGRGNAYISNNATFNSAFKYINSAAAAQYIVSGGTHQWFYAASGTAGNNISFVEAMRIDSSGNVLIGTSTTPSGANIPLVVARGASSYIQLTKTNATAGGTAFGTDGSVAYIFTHTGTVGSETFTQVFAVEKDKSIALQGATPQTGAGITFPATQSASSNANTLDDYEEGSWTPTIAGSSTGGTTTYVAQHGWYVKIGNTVIVGFYVDYNSATGTGALQIGGLPFSSGGGSNYSTGSLMTESLNWDAGTMATLYKNPGTTVFQIYLSGDNISWVTQSMDAAAALLGSCAYQV